MKEQTRLGIIQLLRYGDLLQTAQAVTNIKNFYPKAHLILIARKQFAEPLHFLLEKYFDEFVLLEEHELREDKTTFAEANEFYKKTTTKLNKLNLQLLINLSFNTSSSYLNSFTKATINMGPKRNDNNQIVIEDKWSQYIFSTVMRSIHNPFNLVDLYRNIIGNKADYSSAIDNTDRDDTIVIHPFASQAKKRWKPTKWGETILLLLETTNARIQIVGSNDDLEAQREMLNYPGLQKYTDRIETFCGVNSLEMTYKLVAWSSLFIGHDSMVSHMAALAQTPSLIISLGPVRPHESSPYGNFNITLAPNTECFPCSPEKSCDYFACHNDVSPKVIAELVNQLQQTEAISWDQIISNLPNVLTQNTDFYQAIYPESGQGQFLQRQSGYLDLNELFRNFYYYAWFIYLKDEAPYITVAQISESTSRHLLGHIELITNLREAFRFGVKYTQQILNYHAKENKRPSELQELLLQINEVNSLCNDTAKVAPLLAPVVDFFLVSISNAKGETAEEITQSSLLLYNDAANICEVLIELSEQVLARNNQLPKSVESNA